MHTNTWKKISKVLVVTALCLMACLCVNTVKAQAATKAKVVLEFTDGTKKTWKTGDKKIKLGKKELAYVYFGEYPQTEVTGKALTKAITGAKYNMNGDATVKGVRYKRISTADTTCWTEGSSDDYYDCYDWTGKAYAYFKYEPIKWRVLNMKSGTALILSEYGLDSQQYNEESVEITWADCTLRKWLNDEFLTEAFNSKERKLVKSSTIKNEDNASYGTEGGEDTKDKVFILSMNDVVNTGYGFDSSRFKLDINRRCSSTDFAKGMGAWSTSFGCDYETVEGKKPSCWWLRLPGGDSLCAVFVDFRGSIDDYGDNIDLGANAVRPAMNLNLSSIIK